ncbi:MAG: lipopolysaccharide biosynthesis protein [Candidatus Krumholzibacteria bacterium]|nr:lipopolysaccharide biosynthesis protein [Candidatus Krumholzibacteria bacterium]
MDDNQETASGENGSGQEPSLKHRVLRSVAWVAGLTYLGQVIRWAVTIYVIRLLSPDDFGLMAKAMVFIGFLMMISQLGLEAAIIQKKSITEDEMTHVFGLIIFSNIFIGLVFFFLSPAIADFYSDPRLLPILRVLSSIFLFIPFYVLPRGLLLRSMNFKLKSTIDLIGTLFGAGMTLLFALMDYGIWALVLGGLATQFIWAIGYNLTSRKFILPRFAIKGYKQFVSFGGYLTGSRVLWYFYSKSDIFIGGKFLNNTLLGIYSVALQLASIPIDKFIPIISQVAFPAYSIIQTDRKQVQSHFLKSARAISAIMFLLYGGLFIVAPQLVGIFLGAKWIEVVVPLKLLCLIMPFRAISSLFSPVLNGLGRPEVAFYNVGIATLIMPLGFFIGVRWGILGICLVWLIGFTPVFIIMSNRSLKVLGLSFQEFLFSFVTPLASAALMIAGIFVLNRYLGGYLSPVVQLILYSLSGLCVYLIAMLMLNRQLLPELWQMVRK